MYGLLFPILKTDSIDIKLAPFLLLIDANLNQIFWRNNGANYKARVEMAAEHIKSRISYYNYWIRWLSCVQLLLLVNFATDEYEVSDLTKS